MLFIPSLLEYSLVQLETRLQLVKNNLAAFQKIQNSKSDISFHLDFVMPQFAKDRHVMCSMGLESVLNSVDEYFAEKEVNLSIHLMGTAEDLYQALDFFKVYEFNPKWQYTVYVPANFTSTFSYLTAIFKNLEIGVWLDKNEWNLDNITIISENIKKFLLMTVVAGKSGQKLEQYKIDEVKQLCEKLPKIHFLVDGGWSVESNLEFSNLEIVSYTSFWKQFNLSINYFSKLN